jgi:oligopeptide/dipeptide ABC transporter ATP-binding protein
MTAGGPLMEVAELSIGFPGRDGVVQAADAVSFRLGRGETLGLVGESGCGKSVTLRTLIGLLPAPGQVLGGQVLFEDRELSRMPESELRGVRGNEISMIFQDPAGSLNPVLTIGAQLGELLRVKRGLGRREARAESARLLTRVGIPSAAERLRDYPHQLSGGMRQRVMIAMAVACGPKLLLADEPTTALDVTIQDQILALLNDLQADTGMSMVLVSHDLGVVAQACSRVAVMYAGRIVEFGRVDEVLESPRHPYTEALLEAVPEVDASAAHERLHSIGGQPPELDALPPGCSFAPRCPYAEEVCREFPMTLDRPIPEHGAACVLAHRGTR